MVFESYLDKILKWNEIWNKRLMSYIVNLDNKSYNKVVCKIIVINSIV